MEEVQGAYNWILRIIDSCEHTFHFDAVDKLIEFFSQMYPDQNEMLLMLQQTRAEHWNNVHAVLI